MKHASEHFNAVRPGGYVVTERLGGGGQAEVYGGYKQSQPDPKSLAIKIIQAPDALTTELFEGEVKAMHGLGDHPNVATVHFAAAFESPLSEAERQADIRPQRYLFSVMDRALGSVADEMEYAKRTELGRLPTRIATQYLLDMIAGVAHAHGERPDGSRRPGGIVHRDIKPANALLFEPSGPDLPLQVKLADFGIARRGYDNPLAVTQTHIGAGTFLYADPRQFYEYGALFPHDQYMTAASGLHIVTGIPPFKEFDNNQQTLAMAHLEQPVPIRELKTATGGVDMVGEAVQQVLAKAMSKDIAARYGSMTELGEAVRESLAKSGAKQSKNRQTIDMAARDWRLPLDADAAAYVANLPERYTLTPDSTTKISRRALLAGITATAVGGGSLAWWLTRKEDTKGKADARATRSQTAVPKTYDERLAAAFASKAPKITPWNTTEKQAVRLAVDQVVEVATERLKVWEYVTQMIDLVGPLGQYSPDTAYSLWQWMETRGYPNNKEQEIIGLADPHAWAAASLVDVKTDMLAAVLLSDAWEDKTNEVGITTRANDVRGANRGVLGCALARLRPERVAEMDAFVGASTLVASYDVAVDLTLHPNDKNAAKTLHSLGLDEAPAAAATLAYKNPKVLMADMQEYKDTWNLEPRKFGWALLNLLHNYPDFVQGMLNSKVLDTSKDKFIFGSTMSTSIRAAATHPHITEDIFRRRRRDMPKQVQLQYGLALAHYKPAITKAVLSDHPGDSLLQLALTPADAALRERAVSELQLVLSQDPDRYTNISTLAAAFVCGQQFRLSA